MRFEKEMIPLLKEGDAVAYIDLPDGVKKNVIISKADENCVSFYDSDGLETRSMTEYGVSFVMGEPFARIYSPYRSILFEQATFYAEYFNVPEKESYVKRLSNALLEQTCTIGNSVINDAYVRKVAESVLRQTDC